MKVVGRREELREINRGGEKDEEIGKEERDEEGVDITRMKKMRKEEWVKGKMGRLENREGY